MPSGVARLARPTSTNLDALDGCQPRPAGTGARFSAKEVASTLTGFASLDVLVRRGPPSLLSQFLSHSSPSGTVHQCSLGWCLCSSRSVADAGERGPALLESVLGATPQEFESPILRHADLRQHRCVAAAKRAHCASWAHLMGSFPPRWTLPLPLSAAAMVLVRGITDGAEQRSARRQGVCLPFRAGRDCSRQPGTVNYRPITLGARDLPGD